MDKLTQASNDIKYLWNLMCIEDGISPDAKFVVFSATNKYSAEYNKAVTRYFKLRKKVL